jgi:acetyltransferase-like isoleucine patch superfamily enzyme
LGEINPWSALGQGLLVWYRDFLHNLARFSILFGPFAARWARPKLYRMMGANIGRNVFIGQDVFMDPGYARLITIEDEVGVGARTMIYAHRRNLDLYHKGARIPDIDYIQASVLIKRGASIGVGSIILPGVVIGEGAVISAGTLVNKNIPAYTLAAGYPARVLKEFPDSLMERNDN